MDKKVGKMQAGKCDVNDKDGGKFELSRMLSMKKPEQKQPKWRGKLPPSRGILKLSLSWPNS